MPIRKLQGLRGLRGFTELAPEEQAVFMRANADILNQYRNLRNRDKAANILYMNQQFINKYGLQRFNEMNDESEASFDLRNQVYKNDIINTEFDKLYKSAKGFDYNKYSRLSTDGKLKLMESDYLTPAEFDSQWEKDYKASLANKMGKNGTLAAIGALGGTSMLPTNAGAAGFGEAEKKHKQDVNQRILDRIYNDDVDTAASRFSEEVSNAYYSPEIADLTDEQVKKAFIKAITPGSYIDKNGMPNLGIPEYRARYGESEMWFFGIDDMRQVLAKKKVYDALLPPDMAKDALNNEAKRYMADHQGSIKRFGLFLKDVGISAMSYTADKLNGISELYRMGQNAWAEKPVVMVDDQGNILDPQKTHVVKDRQGNLHYQDEKGNIHSVHQEQVDYTTLHNMGKNTDGSDIEGAFGWDWLTLNPQYWTRAEQFGTLDEDEQKQYEKLGASPYKVAYDPNKDSDMLYEAFKMMSFGIADAASQAVPFGIGALGKSLSTASKVGKIARGFGKVLDTTGKMLTAETKTGQIAQGTAGALGIAYAYNRGTFQETLAQNLANTEEAVTNAAKNEIYNKYNSDKQYKANIDKAVKERAAVMKQEYLRQMQRDGGMRVADMSAIDKLIHARAQEAVLGEMVQDNINKRKASKEYADLQQKAIDGAGDAAFNTFWPEAIKYGFVNNFGYRKFLYTNPAGLTKKMSTSLKGLKEITTAEGKKRLGTDASKFMTRADKWKEFGKTVGSQVWGGAWTNGTDDMQVDAAERINEDSFNRYLSAYQNGEALAATYGFADGLFSYFKGMQNSMGQETTWNAAAIGGLGSVVNFTPNFANIARLATKEGREAYKNNFRREVERDENGIPLKNEDGSPKYKDLGKYHDWRGQLNYFLQNGVLNTYYGKKQSERDLRNHADYVNNLLDSYRDFEDIEHMVASSLASDNLANDGDAKTSRFLNALLAINALNNIGNNSQDPASMSSVIMKAKTLIDKASQLNQEDKNPFSNEEINSLLSQYYAHNPGQVQSEYDYPKALYNIAQNAQKLKEASEAFDKAEEEMQKIEKNRGEALSPNVRLSLKLKQALGNHWQERKERMQSEIEDTSSDEQTMDATTVIASVGGRKNAQDFITIYDRQQKELEEDLATQRKKSEGLYTKLEEANKSLKEAQEKEDSDTILKAQKNVKDAKAEYGSSKEQEKYLESLITMTADKRSSLQNSMKAAHVDETEITYSRANEELTRYQKKLASLQSERKGFLKKNGEPKKRYIDKVEEIDSSIDEYEQNVASRKKTVEANKDKVLTADEIFSLDPVTRARMMAKEHRSLYSKEQQREIEKLEQRLLMKDADALQKIQDIALLSQRIAANQDAYSRIVQNPEAADRAFESQRAIAADAAYNLINQRSAETLSDYIKTKEESLKTHEDIANEDMGELAYLILRKYNPDILGIIDEKALLPQYQQQVKDAQEWSKVVNDIKAIIFNSDKSEEEKYNLDHNIDNIVESSHSREEIVSKLEKVIDDVKDPVATQDFEYLLSEMQKIGYQRDATVLEDRKKRKEREEKQKQEKEAVKKKEEEEKRKADQEQMPKGKEDVKNLEDIDGIFDDESSSTGESIQSEEEIKGESPKTEEGGLPQDSTEAMDVNELMTDQYVDGEVKAGKIWQGSAEKAHQGDFTVTKKDGQITFDIDGKKSTLDIQPTEYEGSKETAQPTENTVFQATSLEKKDGDWYFNGSFAGTNESTQVKAKKDFDLSKAIERQKASKEAEYTSEETSSHDSTLIEEGDTVQSRSETLEEQFNNMNTQSQEIHLSTTNDDSDTQNAVGQQNIDNDITTLSGNAMSEYEPTDLAKDGVLKHKKGKRENDHMTAYYAWMNAAGIKLQNIIDRELPIILQMNSHAKVKFMAVNPKPNATHDDALQGDLMLVLDYDNKINKGITHIHDDANGGVIESNGKKYLIIGTAGYGNRNASKLVLYDILWSKVRDKKTGEGLGIMATRKINYFKEHPQERFYVSEDLHTEIVPGSQIPGYIVRQMETDKEPAFRSVTELLADESRNPMGYKLDSVGWGIQELSQFLILNATPNKVMIPRNPLGNLGSAFVLMPASNGKLVPSYLKVLKYNEMRDGSLKEKADALLQQVTAPDYRTRLEAVKALHQIFYFDKDGDTILLRKSRNEISLVHDGKIFKTFVLDSNFDRTQFMQGIQDMNPRINVTARVLTNKDLLKEYDEAGALMTDAALFTTAGSSYSIYALDREGQMILPATPVNTAPKSTTNSDFKKEDRSQVIFRKQYYREADGVFYLNGKPVTDEGINKQLSYLKRIIDEQLTPATQEGLYNYFILSAGEHPEVIKVNRNTKEVKEVAESQAKELIQKLEEQKAKELREQEAQQVVKGIQPQDTEDIDLNLSDESFTVDPETGEIVPFNNPPSTQETQESVKESPTKEEKQTPIPASISSPASHQNSTLKFSDVIRNRKYKRRIMLLVKEKWPDAPKGLNDIERFLREKNVEVDNIGASDTDIETWIKTIEDCR